MTEELGIKVDILKNFSIIKETLERIGIKAEEQKKFYPSCYLVEENGEYKIYHFKELFLKDGKQSTYTDKDMYRRNTICFLLKNWGLIELDESVKDKEDVNSILVEKVDVLPFPEKHKYRICHKYLFKRSVEN